MTISTEQPATRTAAPERPAVLGPAVRPLTPSEFNTAMVHLYRGEVSRANTWRTRLDGTTNWAVLTTLTTLSFAFSGAKNTHVMIVIHPSTRGSWGELYARVAIGPIPAWLVLLAGVAFNAFVFVLAITTIDRDSDETPTRQETRQRMTGDDRIG